ncbi:MAG TPA: hypothetical protein VLI90_00320, partial [Tepidisphaeraceae bacterium]|nr:hypothetical protein [Tepidisphaeraceae bacterium]
MNSKKRSTGHSFTNTRIGKKAPRSPIAAAVASLFKRRAMFERLEDRTMLSVAGDIDQTFGVAGLRTTNFAGNGNDEAYSVALQSGGNYVVAGGTSGQTAFGLSRYSSAGTLLSSTEASGIGAPGQAQAVAVLPDGGIIAAGYSFALPSNFNFTLVKYTAAGAVDTSWGTSGIVVTPISNRADEAFAIAVQPTGPSSYKVIVAGGNFTSATREAFALARYNSDGSLDSSFGTGGIVTTSVGATGSGEIHALAINGSTLYAGGQAQNAGGNYDFALARYSLANGSLSSLTLTDFSSGSDDRANAMGIDSSGNVYLGGVTGGAAGNFAAAKYNSAGVLDASFGSGGIVTTAFSSGLDAANGLAVQYNGKVLLSGYTTTASGESDLALVRLNSDGSLDSNFGTGGKVTTPVAPVGSHAQGNAVLVDNTKAIVVGSIDNGTNTASPDDFLLARYQLNNAPTLGNSTASLTDITQGQTNNPGTQISVLANAAHLN